MTKKETQKHAHLTERDGAIEFGNIIVVDERGFKRRGRGGHLGAFSKSGSIGGHGKKQRRWQELSVAEMIRASPHVYTLPVRRVVSARRVGCAPGHSL